MLICQEELVVIEKPSIAELADIENIKFII